MNEYKKIVVPVDGSILADLAYQKAKHYAEKNGSKLIVLNVVDTSSIEIYGLGFGVDINPALAQSQILIAGYEKDLKESEVIFETIATVGNPKNEILEVVNEHKADAIFMGASGVNALTRLLIGSTTEYIIRHSPVDVISVKTHLDNQKRPTH
ncbi:MAG: universal stress protein [Enterococcus sp.]